MKYLLCPNSNKFQKFLIELPDCRPHYNMNEVEHGIRFPFQLPNMDSIFMKVFSQFFQKRPLNYIYLNALIFWLISNYQNWQLDGRHSLHLLLNHKEATQLFSSQFFPLLLLLLPPIISLLEALYHVRAITQAVNAKSIQRPCAKPIIMLLKRAGIEAAQRGMKITA